MSHDDSQQQSIQGVETPSTDVIKGSYQVITPNPPPDPVGGNWGTASPSSPPPATESQNNSSTNNNR